MFSCYMATQKRLKAKSTFESKYHSYFKTILKKRHSILFENIIDQNYKQNYLIIYSTILFHFYASAN